MGVGTIPIKGVVRDEAIELNVGALEPAFWLANCIFKAWPSAVKRHSKVKVLRISGRLWVSRGELTGP